MNGPLTLGCDGGRRQIVNVGPRSTYGNFDGFGVTTAIEPADERENPSHNLKRPPARRCDVLSLLRDESLGDVLIPYTDLGVKRDFRRGS